MVEDGGEWWRKAGECRIIFPGKRLVCNTSYIESHKGMKNGQQEENHH